jgi:hypothetical protein
MKQELISFSQKPHNRFKLLLLFILFEEKEDGLDWVHLNQDRVKGQDHMGPVMNRQLPYNMGNSETI